VDLYDKEEYVPAVISKLTSFFTANLREAKTARAGVVMPPPERESRVTTARPA
jgi:hypothetical protein